MSSEANEMNWTCCTNGSDASKTVIETEGRDFLKDSGCQWEDAIEVDLDITLVGCGLGSVHLG